MSLIHVNSLELLGSETMPARSLPPLSALRAFEAAARHGSFRRAAEELNVTQSAVSHQIANLETFLRVRLFTRQSKQIKLTESGAEYFPFLREAFERIGQGTALVTRAGATRELTLQVYVTVAVRWLIPRLYEFQKKNPDLLVRLYTSHLDWEFGDESSDLGFIYTNDPHRPGQHCTYLFKATLFPVCSPKLIQSGPPLKQPSDLAKHPQLILYTATEDWKEWLDGAGSANLEGLGAPKFDSYLLALEAAADSQGVAIAPHFLVASELRSGRLIKPFDIEVPQLGAWYLACRSERANDPRINRIRDWLQAEIAADPTI